MGRRCCRGRVARRPRIIADAPRHDAMPRLDPPPAAPPSIGERRASSTRPARVGLAIAALAIASAACANGPPAGRTDIELRQIGRTFVVDATLKAPVAPTVAWDVLTDFERMDAFVPNLADSRIVARDGNRLTILQHGIARFGPFAMRFESERVVTLAPPTTIRSTQVRGSMEKLDSITTFVPDGAGTRLAYHVEAIPGALFPDYLARQFLRHEIAEQFDAIVREMVRRQAASSATARAGGQATPVRVADARAAQAKARAPRRAGAAARAAPRASAWVPPG